MSKEILATGIVITVSLPAILKPSYTFIVQEGSGFFINYPFSLGQFILPVLFLFRLFSEIGEDPAVHVQNVPVDEVAGFGS